MREIKFRYLFEDTWGKKHTLTETIEELEYHKDIRQNIERGWTLIARDEYTGLKDKNGKEIYEGDIVNVEVKYGEYEEDRLPPTICIAKVYGWGSYFEWIDKSGKTGGGSWLMANTYTDGLEVIGNIYENPELVEGK